MKGMSKQERILLAIQQVENVTKLCESLDYTHYLTKSCSLKQLPYELQRQLSLLQSHEDDTIFDR